jgi:hypothetical protein
METSQLLTTLGCDGARPVPVDDGSDRLRDLGLAADHRHIVLTVTTCTKPDR